MRFKEFYVYFIINELINLKNVIINIIDLFSWIIY